MTSILWQANFSNKNSIDVLFLLEAKQKANASEDHFLSK